MRKIVCGLGVFLAIAICLASVAPAGEGELRKGGVLNVATIGEPPSLDPTGSFIAVVGMISKHYFETLYTFGAGFAIKPLLAEKMPEITPDGRVYTIPLRKGVRFHNGKEMTSEDVAASLRRWLKMASRGKLMASIVDEVAAPDKYTVRIAMNKPFAPILAYLSYPNGTAIIIPAEMEAADPAPFVGTGPYKFAEHLPDRYIRLVRNEEYVPSPDPSDLAAGKRVAYADEIRFIPVPNPNTRIEGALAGQYHYADMIPVENYFRFVNQEKVVPVITQNYGWPSVFLNCREGLMADVRLRRAVQAAFCQEDMMAVAFGEPEFYQVDGSLYPEGYLYHSKRGVELYNQNNPEKAKALMKEAGYNGAPVRLLVSMQYDFHFKIAQVAAENLRAAGFAVDMMVVDWATLTQQRTDPKRWDLFFNDIPFQPEPYLYNFFNNEYPGWWINPKKTELADKFNAEADPNKRALIFGDIQQLFYDDVPAIKVGSINTLGVLGKNVKGFEPNPWPFFWNVAVE